MLALRLAAIAGLALAASFAAAPAMAMSSHDCSVKFKAAQDAGTLNGMKYADFRKANCGTDATTTSTTPTTPASTTPASTTPTAKTPATTPTTAVAAPADNGEPNVTNTEHTIEPSAPTTVAPKGVVFPKAVDPKYASESAGKQRMHTCLDQYHVDKANNTLGGLKWIQKGGGFYSLCNAKLKPAKS
jgi:hypothetical protein